MKKLLAAIILMIAAPGCMVQPYNGCPGNSLSCGSVCCPDDIHYACSAGRCILTSCDSGMQKCGPGCIPLTAPCCNQVTGAYCGTGSQCCGLGCVPLFGVCCPTTSTYCPVGRVCCGNNMCC
jgi:hypothetical protein